MRRWELWAQRPRLIGYCLLIQLGAVVLTAARLTDAAHRHDVTLCFVLAALGIGQAEVSRQVERMRRSMSETPHINMTSVWTFAAVLLLPVPYITAVVVTLYLHSAARVWYRLRRVQAYRMVTNASLVIVTCLISRAILVGLGFPGLATATHQGWVGFAPILASSAAYFVTGALIALPGLNVASHTVEAMFGTLMDNALELSTLCLGAVTAVVLVGMPELGVAVIPPVLLLQRSMLVAQLEVAASTDDKTGVLNTAGWHHLARRELARASRARDVSIGVLMIDLDHFKLVNDRHGHLAGDEVLKAIAARITAEVRDYDSVGRFGGEEFVVLLPDSSKGVACGIAERIRTAISTVQVPTTVDGEPAMIGDLSASIGVAMYPTQGSALDQLMECADAALYRAKTEGRGRVVVFSEAT